MIQMLFANVGGIPVPILPVDRDGNHRDPDGVKWFDVGRAEREFSQPADVLERAWLQAWGDAMPSPQGPADPMIFRVLNGHPVPMLAHAKDGTVRVPDGVEWFTAAQTAERVGMTPAEVRDLWRTVWQDAMPAEAERVDAGAGDDGPLGPLAARAGLYAPRLALEARPRPTRKGVRRLGGRLERRFQNHRRRPGYRRKRVVRQPVPVDRHQGAGGGREGGGPMPSKLFGDRYHWERHPLYPIAVSRAVDTRHRPDQRLPREPHRPRAAHRQAQPRAGRRLRPRGPAPDGAAGPPPRPADRHEPLGPRRDPHRRRAGVYDGRQDVPDPILTHDPIPPAEEAAGVAAVREGGASGKAAT